MKWARTNDANRIRSPAAAGRFYSSDPAELRDTITSFLREAAPSTGPVPKALIAPHAGYIFSGPIAASAYARFLPARETIKRVILLGPSHFVAFNGVAGSSAEAFATPLGVVPVDVKTMSRLTSSGQIVLRDEAHLYEHSLEVHLPFLQVVLSDFLLVPLVAGNATTDLIADLLDMLWNGPETRIVISSDLSHYLGAGAARRLDRATADAIEALDPDALAEDQACGRIPIRGLLQSSRRHGLVPRTLDLRNSGDTAGNSQRVVGYGAFAFEEQSA